MVERFNGRIADVLKTHRFSSSEDLEQTLLRYVALYNHQLPPVSAQEQDADADHEGLVQRAPAFVSQAAHMIIQDVTPNHLDHFQLEGCIKRAAWFVVEHVGLVLWGQWLLSRCLKLLDHDKQNGLVH